VGVVLLAIMGMGTMAQGQIIRRLPPELPRTEALNAVATEQIAKFIGEATKALVSGANERSVKDARDALIDPLQNPTASQAFKDHYVKALLPELKSSLTSPKPHLRMNGLIVLAEFRAAAVAEPAVKALSDKHPGCRYWAAKTIADVGAIGGPLTNTSIFSHLQQSQILAALKVAMPVETQALVLEQMYRDLSVLKIAEAQDALLEVLNKRVALHVDGIDEDMRADLAGLNGLKVNFVLADAQGLSIDRQARALTATAAKYLQVCAKALQENKIKPELKGLAVDVVKVVEEIFLELAVKRFHPELPADKRPALSKHSATENFPELLLGTMDWVGDGAKPGVLSDPQYKIAIPADQLKLPAGK
jgi:hypothetical protein